MWWWWAITTFLVIGVKFAPLHSPGGSLMRSSAGSYQEWAGEDAVSWTSLQPFSWVLPHSSHYLSYPWSHDEPLHSLKTKTKNLFQISSEVQFISCQDYLPSLSISYSIAPQSFLYCPLFMGMKNLSCLLFLSFWKSKAAWLLAILTLPFLFLIPQITFPLCLIFFAVL